MYEAYLRALLEPLRVYDLSRGTINGAELAALGAGFDGIGGKLDTVERESLTATAEDEGLRRREALFARRPAAATAEERRAAIAALLQIDGDSLTPDAMDRTLRGCGIRARAWRWGTAGCGSSFRRWRVSRRSSTRLRRSFWTSCPATWKWSSISAT